MTFVPHSSSRPIILALVVLALVAGGATRGASGQITAHTLRAGSTVGATGDIVVVRVGLAVPNSAGAVQGFQWSLCHDFTAVRPIGVTIGSGVALSNNGLPPDFHEAAFHPGDAFNAGGVRQACIPCFSACATLTGTPLLLEISYEIVGTTGGVSPLSFCLGSEIPPFPPLPPAVAVAGNSITPLLEDGLIDIVRAEPFRRGDLDGDAVQNIADAVQILNGLFSPGGMIGCADAADVNDDGGVNIADAITLLGFLFLQGAPPPAPFPDCGLDPTPDPLDCALLPSC